MTNAKTSARLSAIVLRALRTAGVRGVIHAGWADLAVSTGDVLTIGEAPHEWLFPHMAAVVHACGAGSRAPGCVPVGRPAPQRPRSIRESAVWPPCPR
jgi:UDP:flavonoid glycosyltransferase YjiC (YdhE family)